jgi:dsDNA-specific endonuclease/ATPase MutS2
LFIDARSMTDPDDDSPFPEPVSIPIRDSIDLHYFRAAEIGQVVEAYLEAAVDAGLREVRLIHGRGKGVQRGRVQRLLARSPHVERFADAPGDEGGWGATIAWLRPSEPC